MKIQSKDKLVKDVERVMSAYGHLISGIDSMDEIHHIPSLGVLDTEKAREEVIQDIQTFLQPMRKSASSQDLLAPQENIIQFFITPVQIYTKLASLSNQILVKRRTLVPDALECFYRLREDTP